MLLEFVNLVGGVFLQDSGTELPVRSPFRPLQIFGGGGALWVQQRNQNVLSFPLKSLGKRIPSRFPNRAPVEAVVVTGIICMPSSGGPSEAWNYGPLNESRNKRVSVLNTELGELKTRNKWNFNDLSIVSVTGRLTSSGASTKCWDLALKAATTTSTYPLLSLSTVSRQMFVSAAEMASLYKLITN